MKLHLVNGFESRKNMDWVKFPGLEKGRLIILYGSFPDLEFIGYTSAYFYIAQIWRTLVCSIASTELLKCLLYPTIWFIFFSIKTLLRIWNGIQPPHIFAFYWNASFNFFWKSDCWEVEEFLYLYVLNWKELGFYS